ncbi:hypothetical protein GF336_06880 [Candidatus Woesearchaeota archaeon]|nr:hypothetical protein [Candidatus Woesearchaeota archaeon]
MLEFLKKLFKKEKIELPLAELPSWLDRKEDEKSENLNKFLPEKYEEIKELLKSSKEKAEELEEAEVKDEEKIRSKVKHVVLSHRRSYTDMLKRFLDTIEVPSSADYKEAMQFYKDTQEKITEFSKSTVKSYHATMHLFADNTESITADLKELDTKLKTIKELIEKSGLKDIEKAENMLKDMKKDASLKSELEKEITKEKEHLEKTKRQQDILSEEKISLEQGTEFNKLNKDKEELEAAENKLNELKTKVINLFSPLETALKKYKRVALENEAFVASYLDNPFDALLKDENLTILKILEKLGQNLDLLDMKDSKRKKTSEAIHSITSSVLTELKQAYDFIQEKRKSAAYEIDSNEISSKIEEKQIEIDSLRKKSEDISSSIAEKQERLDKIDLENSRKELENQLSSITKAEVTFSS